MTIQCPNFSTAQERCFIIAEAGVNHNGDMALAHKLIDGAKWAGAGAVKFQAFVTEEIVTVRAHKAAYQEDTTGAGSQFAMLKALELTGEQQAELKRHCEQDGLVYICTPYDVVSLDMLDRLAVAAYKIASTDLDNVLFMREVAAKGRPVILSTGMATLSEIEPSVTLLKNARLPWTVLLQCTSEYPAPGDESNLRAIATLREAFGLPVGFSDHTDGITISPLAVALGACLLEKHFTLDRAMTGPDHRASLDPSGFRAFVDAVRAAEAALGDGIKVPTASERKNKPRMRKSVVAGRAIGAGEVIGLRDLTCKRPGDGLAPAWADKMIGKRTAVALTKDQQITLDSVVW